MSPLSYLLFTRFKNQIKGVFRSPAKLIYAVILIALLVLVIVGGGKGAAEMEAKKMILAAKQECLDSAFANAQKQLLSLPEDKYADLLASLAVKAAATGREEILLNQRDHDRVGPQVAAKANAILAKNAAPELPDEMKASKAGNILSKVVTGASALLQGTAMLTLSDETRDMEGGLTLRDGNVEVNCAFETQLRVLRESMAAQVAAVLFA